MGPTRRPPIVLAVLAASALFARAAAAEPIFASPPHVVADDEGRRIVLFLNEPVSGALASRAGNGFEVRVPRSVVAPAIQGQDYGSDGWGNGGDSVRHLVLAAGEKGDTRIRIEPSVAVAGVDAHSVDDPPRLVIELLAAAATRTAVPTRTPGRSPAGARSAAAERSPSAAATTASVKAKPTATPRPRATPAPTATADGEPVAIAAAGRPVVDGPAAGEPPSAAALARATVRTALAAAPSTDVQRTSLEAARAAGTASSGAPVPETGSPVATGRSPESAEPNARAVSGAAAADARTDSDTSSSHPAPASMHGAPADAASVAPAPPRPAPGAAPLGLACLWRRFGGLAVCVADPKAAPYAGDHTVTALVGALARGKLPEPEDTPAVATPALAFLKADELFARRAPEGKLLPVVEAYRRALRQHPQFPDAWRARLNVALAYRAMEFLTELRTAAREAKYDPTAGLVHGLAGDLASVAGQTAIAAEEYGRAAEAGGLGACLAGRGRARLALAAGDATTAAAELAGLAAQCPPELAADAETVWMRGRLALAQQDLVAAKTLLGDAEPALGKADRGGVIADLGAVAEAAGNAEEARRAYGRLVGGAFGARAAREATVRLAILDGAGGDVAAGLKRLERLTPEASDPARRALVMQTARTALARGAAGEAIAALHEAHVDPTELAVDDQIMVAEAHRALGLLGEAERVLAAAEAQAGAQGSDTLFAARGDLALARGDAAQGLAIAEAWIRARGRSAGALALKARAAALAGDALAAHASVAAAVIEDGRVARTLALDVAEMLRTRAPEAALVLAQEALEPGPAPELPATRAAQGLALVGTLAEAVGDDDTALAAFTTLTARHPKEPVAADAAYRAARLAARRVPAGAPAAWDEAVRAKDPLARRVAGAARQYDAIVKPFAGAGSEP